ncbi:hypothetical protein ASU33_04985 [Solirubrum puertoriconensis]|uniref:Uncharacterized protein n=1 Tax=Solirubrum puertoriconensis TaxID=1751427 RepID=A0A9X0L3M8_SOLP1|nr:hypothetical protein ASU33_04985 [Solirubrum puertoriconensis]
MFGTLPIADAFIAWSNSWQPHTPLISPSGWPLEFQAYSLAGAAMLLGVLFWLWRNGPSAGSQQLA